MQSRVVAVVVTYNRLSLLQRLLERLGEVRGLAEVLVVDNASSDGTGQTLAKLADRDPGRSFVPVSGRTLSENRGGSGGFREGLAWAMERGADLAWLMDDDGRPDLDCLPLLLKHDCLDFWGPTVLAEQDPSACASRSDSPAPAASCTDCQRSRVWPATGSSLTW